MNGLKSQTASLQIHIIELINLVLNLCAIIKQRAESFSCFTKLVIDPQTRKEKKDEAGDATKFVPKTFTQYKGDPRMKAQEDAVLAYHLEWQANIIARAEQRSKLEIEVRYKYLKKVYNCTNNIATGWYTDCFYHKLVPSDSQLSKENYANIVAYKLVGGFSYNQAKIFGFKADKLMVIEDVDPTYLGGFELSAT
jgi:hypothetical protein